MKHSKWQRLLINFYRIKRGNYKKPPKLFLVAFFMASYCKAHLTLEDEMMLEDIFNPKFLIAISFVAGIGFGFLEKPTMKYFLILLIVAAFFYFVGSLMKPLTPKEGGNVLGLYDRNLIWVPLFVSGAITVLFRLVLKKNNKWNGE
jgi:hypothetical protein